MVKIPLYKVVDWDSNFENYRSRVITKCAYVCIPNKHGGMGLSNVLGEADGAMIYGIWVLLLQLCSRQTKREGWVTADGKKDGRRLTGEELARAFRRPIREIYRTLKVVSQPDVGWLALVEGVSEWEQEEVIERLCPTETSSNHRPNIVEALSEHRPSIVRASSSPQIRIILILRSLMASSECRPSIVPPSSKHRRKKERRKE